MKESGKRSPFREIGQLAQWLAARLGGLPWGTAAILAMGIILAVALRYSLLDFKSTDYFGALRSWYNAIRTGGYSAFATNFSNYNPPYLYVLYLIVRFLPGIPGVVAVKLPALTADFVCAGFVYLIVRLKFLKGRAPVWAAMAMLFAPSVVLNSAFWGQADSLYTAGILACTYFLMSRRNALAILAFAVALALKLQAIFLAPFLFVLLVRRVYSWKYLVFVPAILVLALLPAWLAGRPLMDLLNIYLFQASEFQWLTMNAPSLYSWLPATNQVFNLLYVPGVLIGAIAAFMFTVIVYKAKNQLTRPLVLELTLIILLLMPFFLPKMHDRYFYPTDVLSIAFAFYFPQFFYVPILIGGVSFLAYQQFLFGSELVPLPILTLALLVVIAILLYHTILALYLPPLGEHMSWNQGIASPAAGLDPQPIADQKSEKPQTQ